MVFSGSQNIESNLNSMNSVAKILEMLAAEETQHMRRVSKLVDTFVYELKFSDLFQKNLDGYQFYGTAAFYHDIGKVWIPLEILTKPNKLTELESHVIRQHPVFAKKLFDQIKLGLISGMPEHLIQLAADSAIYHHEWWDGSGYPFGMKYDSIPLIARMTSICDAYDAMTSNRIYRKSHSHDHARQELKRYAGIQFDPKLVAAFLAADIDLAFSFTEASLSHL